MVNTLFMVIAWVMAIVNKDIERSFNMSLPVLIVTFAISNYLMHNLIYSLTGFVTGANLPFIAISCAASTKYYMSFLASMLNMASVLCLYINTVFDQ